MVAEEFLGLIDKFKISTYVGLEDFADRLNFMLTVVLITLSLLVVTVKSYFFKPLSCYTSVAPTGGSGFDHYMENYCWVHGTIPILADEHIPQKPEGWAEMDSTRRITYYQWVPFILGLQCILFYLPKIVWQIICYNKLGTNLETLVDDANKASILPPGERKAKLERISRTLEDMLFKHRDYRQSNLANVRRRIYSYCNFCVFSKHLGTWLVLCYFAVKFLYGVNVIGQLYLMKRFLGFNQSMVSFGYTVLDNLANGMDWHQTGIFPRIGFCYNGGIRHVGASNAYVAQCALPINMLNEKIYIFLWFWIFLVGVITLISILVWFVRLISTSRRSRFIKKFLIMNEVYRSSENQLLDRFIIEYLRHDGLFLIRMIFINAGDMVTADIVGMLWKIYKEKYIDVDFRNFNNYRKLNGNDFTRDQSSENSMRDDKDNFV